MIGGHLCHESLQLVLPLQPLTMLLCSMGHVPLLTFLLDVLGHERKERKKECLKAQEASSVALAEHTSIFLVRQLHAEVSAEGPSSGAKRA